EISAIAVGHGTWLASRVDVLPPGSSGFSLQGKVDQLIPAQSGAVVGGEFVHMAPGIIGQLTPGEQVVLTGQFAANTPVATQLAPAPQIFGPVGSKVEIEDAFMPSRTVGRLVAPDGLVALAPPHITQGALASISVITGTLDPNGEIAITQIAIPQTPDGETTRPQLLNRGEIPEPGETSHVGAAEPEAPEVEPPSSTTPDIESPEISAPEISPPEISPPEITTPDTND
ncbi:MAG TPA: hypothetical protein PLY97_08010, partial [Acidocella sp.]|nr:hypothetical protein [Acidocella sp.]